LPLLGATIPLLGGPITHVRRGRFASAGLSAGLHLALPLAFAPVGWAVAPGLCRAFAPDRNYGSDSKNVWCSENAPVMGIPIGFVSGMVLAGVVDAGLLAWDRPTPEPARPSSRGALVPLVDAGGARLLWTGVF
jgi:hypothetical protein